LRAEVFAWWQVRTTFEDVLRWSELQDQFSFDGQRLALIAQNGIRKPAGLDAALAISTTYTPSGGRPPYEDAVGSDGLPRGFVGEPGRQIPVNPDVTGGLCAWRMSVKVGVSLSGQSLRAGCG